MNKCIFCRKIKNGDVVHKNKHVVVIKDEHPVSDGHLLIIPLRCKPNFFYLTPEEFEATRQAIHLCSDSLMAQDASIDGFNIGWNAGGSAGQTVEHVHCHLIPRRTGDCKNPIGGIRKVIDGKGDYTE